MRTFPIRKLAALIGKEMAGGPSPSEDFAAGIPHLTGSYVSILEGLLAERRRKPPHRATLAGFGYMAGAVLNQLRRHSERGDPQSVRAIHAARLQVGDTLTTGKTDLATLLAVSRAFAQAGLDPGVAFHGALATALTDDAGRSGGG